MTDAILRPLGEYDLHRTVNVGAAQVRALLYELPKGSGSREVFPPDAPTALTRSRGRLPML
jgi:hypothetical protein